MLTFWSRTYLVQLLQFITNYIYLTNSNSTIISVYDGWIGVGDKCKWGSLIHVNVKFLYLGLRMGCLFIEWVGGLNSVRWLSKHCCDFRADARFRWNSVTALCSAVFKQLFLCLQSWRLTLNWMLMKSSIQWSFFLCSSLFLWEFSRFICWHLQRMVRVGLVTFSRVVVEVFGFEGS